MKGRNLLFLDIDGVHNNSEDRVKTVKITVDRSPVIKKQGLTLTLRLNPTNLHFFNIAYEQILDKYNTQVILSSTWRFHDDCFVNLINRGLLVNFGGKTGYEKTRALEILGYTNDKDKYIVIDDEIYDIYGDKAKEEGTCVSPHRVLKIDNQTGFTEQDSIKLLDLADKIYGND